MSCRVRERRHACRLLLTCKPTDCGAGPVGLDLQDSHSHLVPNSPGDFAASLRAIRERGYEIDAGQGHPGICCLAAPVVRSGQVEEALTVISPAEHWASHGPALLCAACALARVAGEGTPPASRTQSWHTRRWRHRRSWRLGCRSTCSPTGPQGRHTRPNPEAAKGAYTWHTQGELPPHPILPDIPRQLPQSHSHPQHKADHRLARSTWLPGYAILDRRRSPRCHRNPGRVCSQTNLD